MAKQDPSKCAAEPGLVNKDCPAFLSKLSHGSLKRLFMCLSFSLTLCWQVYVDLTQARFVLEEGILVKKISHQIGLWARLWGIFLSWWLMWEDLGYCDKYHPWTGRPGCYSSTCVFLSWDTLWEVRTHVSIISLVSNPSDKLIIISLINMLAAVSIQNNT